jgi:hypothetical protein
MQVFDISRKTLFALAVAVLTSASVTHAAIVTYQQGIAGYSQAEDTFLSNANPNTNFGGLPDLGVSGPGTSNEFQSLLGFYGIIGGGAGQIPLNAVINSATLGVYNSSVSAGAAGSIHRMLVPWVENTVTWNSFNGGLNNIPAGEFVAAPSFSGLIGGGPFNVTSIVQAWANGAPNLGMAFIPNGVPTGGIVFRSSENAATQLHPILIVNYSVPEPMTLSFLFTACVSLLLVRGRRMR